MCGIAVLIESQDSKITDLIPQLTAALRHRGPDDEGFVVLNKDGDTECWAGKDTPDDSRAAGLPYTAERNFEPRAGAVSLGHRRLSILDLSAHGHQPLCSVDGTYWISYNGEVYNYRELRTELQSKGYKFKTGTDTETILAAYDCWGRDMLQRFVGMFSIAILDGRKKKLFVARDFFGIKPLYYWHGKEGLAFASEIKALLKLPQVSREVNPRRLYLYLLNGVTDFGDETLFKNIKQLPSAHFLEIDLKKTNGSEYVPTPQRYWSIEDSHDNSASALSFEDAAKKLRDIFLENISLHMRADVPVGAALSGGIDSSSIFMAMRHIQGPSLELHGFSFIPNDTSISEEEWIDLVGSASKAKIHKVYLTPGDLREDLDRLVRCQDEPFGSTSIYAQHRVFRLAQETGIKVMLDGQGADEILAGYFPCYGARLSSLFYGGRWLEALQFSRALNKIPQGGLKHGVLHLGKSIVPQALHKPARQLLGKSLTPFWINEKWFQSQNVKMESPFRAPRSSESLKQTLRDQLTKTSLPALLRYEDRNSMIHSIESRVPFLTPKLAGFMYSLPEEYLIAPDGTTKAVFRRAMRGIVPDPILDRKDKIGFNTPERIWMTGIQDWVTSTLKSEYAQNCQALNLAPMQENWQFMLSNKIPFSFHTWRWVNFIRWAEINDVQF